MKAELSRSRSADERCVTGSVGVSVFARVLDPVDGRVAKFVAEVVAGSPESFGESI